MDQQLQRVYLNTACMIQSVDTSRSVPESDVTAIAHLLLECGDKDGHHGYFRRSEAIIRTINPGVVPGDYGSSLRPDIAVTQRMVYNGDQLIYVFHDGDESHVLIVECKSDHDYNRHAMTQLRAYMRYSQFLAGLLLSQRRASFFFQDVNGEWIQPGPEFSDISQHVPEIADIIRAL
ncbi:hypothetical protein IWQ62_001395 [Dispira parvispora]|uniref:Uncharacterized protein n=1 Tax=Dispira parvispora TaxID=1520584 RepID=A0A9W8AZ33_9FUNG|nr:hypothetical protein IWQ62_001395 [Dispira parvispora]